MFTLKSCDYDETYSRDNATCTSCTNALSFVLPYQGTSCTECGTSWCSSQKTKLTDFESALYQAMCSTFDPTTLSNYQECLKKNDTNDTNGTDPDPDGSSGSSVNTSAILAGVLVPVFFIALVIGAYFGYKKWKQHKAEE